MALKRSTTYIQLIIVAGTLLAACTSFAEIYKHVDKNGNVTYSDVKPSSKNEKSVTTVAPDENTVNVFGSDEQAENQRASEDFFEKKQKLREKEASKAQALARWRKQLKAAQLELKMAKRARSEGVVAEEGDFVGVAGGGARPSASYFNKLEQLDANVVIAEQKLATIRHQKPF